MTTTGDGTHGLFVAASSAPAAGKKDNTTRDDDLEDLEAYLFESDGSDGW